MNTKEFFAYLEKRDMKAVIFTHEGKLMYVHDFATCELYMKQLFGDQSRILVTSYVDGYTVTITDGVMGSTLRSERFDNGHRSSPREPRQLHIVYWWILGIIQMWTAYHILEMMEEQFEPLRKGAEEGKLYSYLQTI